MKRTLMLSLGGAGLVYGLLAVLTVYRDAPLEMQAFIVAGVAAAGAGVGWVVGALAAGTRRKGV